MHVAIERNSWRLPQDDIVQVANPRSKIKEIPDDLAYAGLSDGQYWRSVILALLVISLVIAGIASAIVAYGFVDELLYSSGKRIRLDDVLNTTTLFRQRLPSMWITSSGFIYQSDDGDLTLYNTTTNSITILISNYTLNQLNVKEYQCSHDMKNILLKTNINQIFKNTYTSHVMIYTIKNGHQMKLVNNESDVIGSEMQSVEWAGNTSNIIFVKDNDIYVKYNLGHEEVRITSDGKPGYVYNGVPDWLYQEEIFLNSKKAFWSSADGSLLLYASFNDTPVASLEFPWVEEDPRQYEPLKVPTTRSVRYPTPETNIPEVKLWIVNITKSNANSTRVEVRRPSLLLNQDYYLASAGWVSEANTRIAVVWMSRAHNFSYVTYCEAPFWTCKENYREAAPPNMWLEIHHQPLFAADGQSYLMLGPVQENGQQYFTQIKHITLEAEHMRVITYGRHDVLQILAWDEVNHNVYYLGMDEMNTGEQHLYVVNDQTVGDTVRPQTRCITCEVKHLYNDSLHFNAYFPSSKVDNGAQYYVIECDEQPVPIAGVHSLKDHTLRRMIFSGQDHDQPFDHYALPKRIFQSIPLPKGYTARVQSMMPPSWRPELRDAAFPVIVQVDGRPNSQLVSRKWKTDWGLYMSARKGVIYIKMDVRGSKGQSSSDLYRLLGDVEVEDQISVIRKMMNMNRTLDRNRFGVWGWGYGGYTATMLMNSQYNVFKCGIAVAPISDWRYYNAAFSEKILGLKTTSSEGYMRSDLKTKTNFIASDSFYIIQGLADLSVPYQHGIMLANALTRSSKLFKHQVYANEGHELVNVLNHMYRTMEHHFSQCLALEEEDFPNHV